MLNVDNWKSRIDKKIKQKLFLVSDQIAYYEIQYNLYYC